MTWNTTFIIVLVCTTLIYGFYIVRAMLALKKSTPSDNKLGSATIIIPFRDETEVLEKLENRINELFSSDKYEIIWVNDHSTGYIPKEQGNNRVIRSKGEGKKKALITGALMAQTDTLIFFDADVQLADDIREAIESNWSGNGMLALPVIQTGKGAYSVFNIESVLILGLTAGLINSQDPILVNGAGLIVNKKQWIEHIDKINHFFKSGDDMFMLFAFKKDKLPIQTIVSPKAIVRTEIPNSFKSFMRQRVRWAGKSKAFTDFSTRLFGISLLLLYGLYITFPWMVQYTNYQIPITSILILKIVLDGLLYAQTCNLYKEFKSWPAFIILQLIYPIYVLTIPILSLIWIPDWKGRIGR